MTNLSETLAALAEAFATEVLALVRAGSVEDIPSEPQRAARSPADVKRMGPEMIDSVASLITSYVKSHQGANGATIQKELGIAPNTWPRPRALALEKKGLSKKGQK